MKNPGKIFSKIYDKYINKIYRFIFIRVNSQEIAEDLASETFLRGWQAFKNQKSKIKNQKEIENPQAFLYQIARNLVIDHYRERGRTQIISADYVPIVDPGRNLEEIAEAKSDFEIVKSAMSNLNDVYQEVIIWHYIEDLSIPEIAKILNKPEGTVRVTLHRALKALEQTISNEQ